MERRRHHATTRMAGDSYRGLALLGSADPLRGWVADGAGRFAAD